MFHALSIIFIIEFAFVASPGPDYSAAVVGHMAMNDIAKDCATLPRDPLVFLLVNLVGPESFTNQIMKDLKVGVIPCALKESCEARVSVVNV